MSASRSSVTTPPGPATVAQRYHRVERAVSTAFALLVVGAITAVLVSRSLVVGLGFAVLVVALVRVPLAKTGGTARLVADGDPEAVVAAFTGPTPPPLVLQWTVADEVRPTEDGAVYEFSYLFGLRGARLETTARRTTPSAGSATAAVELTVTENGHPWGHYSVSVADDAGETVVDVEWTADRRFALPRVLQWLVARRYRRDALATQGYRVTAYDDSLSL